MMQRGTIEFEEIKIDASKTRAGERVACCLVWFYYEFKTACNLK